MDRLETLVELLREIRPSRHPPGIAPDMLVWTGVSPKDSDTIGWIAEEVGYKREQAESFHRLSRPDASVWLHLLATTSLMHGGRYVPNTALSEAIESGFDALGVGATFLSNCGWSFIDEVAEQKRPGPFPRFVHTEPLRAGGPWTDSARYSVHWETGFQQLRDPSDPDTYDADGGLIAIGDGKAFFFWVKEVD